MDKVIEISNLYKIFKNSRGIENINLDIYKGEIFGFLGPNGSGKTTTMKLMTGLIKPDRGDVKILGYSITDNPEKALSNMGCLIENAVAYPYLTAFENLRQFSRYYEDVDSNRICEVLDSLDLLKYKDEKPIKFSLGMKQRLGIAATILSKPKVVILDEPLNGLDVEGMISIRNIIKKMSEEENTTFFISSHLIHDIELTCTRIGILYNGRIINTNTTKNILQNYPSLEDYFVEEVKKNEQL
ncbi:ABC transporter ATP-binding protein [Clostridium sp. cel8]|jgi:ABC-2 type transport system ATP-binding protein|uniref:ABC transporter ATP-binding protein n=1 Tax=Clostridium sp. cel8 TaxID=2663123 RepID=UPI0015F65AE0|nr:ABC transporter ATP-binding protein [Clostridium sp. cel8]MBA5851049.1 ABC transporter ATP-binding protein [Clostridium sp. cel8]